MKEKWFSYTTSASLNERNNSPFPAQLEWPSPLRAFCATMSPICHPYSLALTYFGNLRMSRRMTLVTIRFCYPTFEETCPIVTTSFTKCGLIQRRYQPIPEG